jgi:hypothetical protein
MENSVHRKIYGIIVFLALVLLFKIAYGQDLSSIPFIENNGQYGSNIYFGVNTIAGNVYISGEHEIIYNITQREATPALTIKEMIESVKDNVPIIGKNRSVTHVNFIKSNGNIINVDAYEYVDMGEILEGISLKLSSVNHNVEKVFTVEPYADPSAIKASITGADRLYIDKNGELVITSAESKISFTKPFAYQFNKNGTKEFIDIAYNCTSLSYGYKIGKYDRSKLLFIDPLIATTFVGGSTYDDDYGVSMLIDNEGFVYLSGYTLSSDFPVSGGYDSTINGSKDLFVAKFSNDLSTLIAATFIGGSSSDFEATMAFDNDKHNIYLAGYTQSEDFPITANAFDSIYNGNGDVYVLKLNKDLNVLDASTYFGGTGSEGRTWPKLDITCTSSGNVCLAGLTCSDDLPIISGITYDSVYNGGSVGGDAFLAVFDSTLSQLLGCTYLGGSANEWRVSVATDQDENVFVSGETESADFEFTTNAYDDTFNGGSDIFICKYSQDLSQLLSATAFGNYHYEEPLDIALDAAGSVYIGGYTKSANFKTTQGAYQRSFAGGDRDGYVAKFTNDLTELEASTFLGGSLRDDIYQITIGALGNVVVTGNTTSVNFPTTVNAFDDSFNGGGTYGDCFVATFNADLNELIASTYLGGSADDKAHQVSCFNDNVFVSGYTHSNNFPFTSAAYDTINGGSGGNNFIVKFTPDFTSASIKKNDIRSINCYPNPATDQISFEFSLFVAAKTKLIIYDYSGRCVGKIDEKTYFPGTTRIDYNIHHLQSGIYFMKFQSGATNEILKFMVL